MFRCRYNNWLSVDYYHLILYDITSPNLSVITLSTKRLIDPANSIFKKYSKYNSIKNIYFLGINLSKLYKLLFSNILVLEQLGSWPSYSQIKHISCVTKLQVSILFPAILSWWHLCDQSHISQATNKGYLVFEQIASQFSGMNEWSLRTEVLLCKSFMEGFIKFYWNTFYLRERYALFTELNLVCTYIYTHKFNIYVCTYIQI